MLRPHNLHILLEMCPGGAASWGKVSSFLFLQGGKHLITEHCHSDFCGPFCPLLIQSCPHVDSDPWATRLAPVVSHGIVARACGSREFYKANDTTCRRCPEGAVCRGDDWVVTQDNYWRASNATLVFLPCGSGTPSANVPSSKKPNKLNLVSRIALRALCIC